MNDNEIVGTFENNCNSCENCPYHIYSDCDDRNRKDIIDLIKRQQAEIERLKEENKHHRKTIAENERRALDVTLEEIEKARAEAVKEFAERVKYEFCPDCDYSTNEIRGTLNYLVKEMTEKGGASDAR